MLTAIVPELAPAAAPAQQFALERSTNLNNWIILVTNTANSNGAVRFEDRSVTNEIKAAFYPRSMAP